jgi:(p)ppGpp synthase/HD superfamily hydrolase
VIDKAKQLAHEAHSGQLDKAGKEYISHPEAVANMVETADEKVVAWLHDVLEDSDITEETLRSEFPDPIVDAVIALTHKSDETYDDYLCRLSQNPLAVTVKLADLEHNSDLSRFDSPSKRDIDRAQRYKERSALLLNLIK